MIVCGLWNGGRDWFRRPPGVPKARAPPEYHCVALTGGYDEQRRTFRVKNSWGSGEDDETSELSIDEWYEVVVECWFHTSSPHVSTRLAAARPSVNDESDTVDLSGINRELGPEVVRAVLGSGARRPDHNSTGGKGGRPGRDSVKSVVLTPSTLARVRSDNPIVRSLTHAATGIVQLANAPWRRQQQQAR